LWVGLAGAAAGAVWFLGFDLVAGVPFPTPALLGAVLFHGLPDPTRLLLTPRLGRPYHPLPRPPLLPVRRAGARLFTLADRDRHVLFAVFMLFLCFEVAAFALVTVLASWLLHTITPAAIIGANLIATVIMLFLLFRNHRRAPGEVSPRRSDGRS